MKKLEKRGYTEKEASDYLGLSLAFLRKDRVNGVRDGYLLGPNYIKFGKNVRYLKEDIEAWIEKNRVIRKAPDSD
jgi:hypothetical protein